jgi:acyl-CoA synthetase (AMP-forming)/AMP-acid ligase II/acyl carrier protein
MSALSLGDLALSRSLVAHEVRRWPWQKDSAQWRAATEARSQCAVEKRDVLLLRDPDLTDMTKLFDAACREFSPRPAYRVGPKWINYAECQTRVSSIAAALSDVLSDHRRTSGKQPVIAVLLPNNYVVLESFFAAALTYAIVLPINHRLTPPEITTALQVSGAVILVTSNAFSNVLAEIAWGDISVRTVAWASDPVDLPVSDQRLWETLVSHPVSSHAFSDKEPARYLQGFSTSGTTGKTKTVLHTHRNVQAHTLATIEALGLSAEDDHCWAHFGPMFHVGDAVFVWIAALLGARHVFHENQLQVADVARLLAAERVTIVKLVPSMLRLMCASESTAGYNFQALRWILTGGAAPDSALVQKTNQLFGCDFIQGYGMTEATCHIAFKCETRELSAEGLQVLPGLELRIVNLRNEPVKAGEIGEIAIKGDTVFDGYVLGGEFMPVGNDGFTNDGFFLTGDLGYLDKAGHLHIAGRSKDMINVGGENVFAWEVEETIRRMPNVKDCAAFSVPHAILGEIVGVAVVSEGLTEDDVKSHCRPLLATFKIPQQVHFLEQLPRTGTGKVQKHLILEQLGIHAPIACSARAEGSSSSVPQSVTDTVEQIVLDFLKKINLAAPAPDQPLFDAGLDSLGALELIELFERRFRINVSPVLLYDYPTLNALKEYFRLAFRGQVFDDVANDGPAEAVTEPDQAPADSTHRRALTSVAVLLELIGLCIRPALLAASLLPVLIVLDLCSGWLNRFELSLMGALMAGLVFGEYDGRCTVYQARYRQAGSAELRVVESRLFPMAVPSQSIPLARNPSWRTSRYDDLEHVLSVGRGKDRQRRPLALADTARFGPGNDRRRHYYRPRHRREMDSNPQSPGHGELCCRALRSLLRRAGGGEVGTAVQPDFFCSASHSIEPGCHTVPSSPLQARTIPKLSTRLADALGLLLMVSRPPPRRTGSSRIGRTLGANL